MRLRNEARPGVTLVEVLAAIFIMGVGMLAVLVLFPLGALRMAAALKDGRCGVIAANADSISTLFDMRNDPAVSPYLKASYTPPAPFAPPDPQGRGYAVFVDPYFLYGGVGSPLGAGGASPGLPRVAPLFAPNLGRTERWFTFLDDMTFETNGYPRVGGGGVVERQWKYTWAYMLKRSRSSDAQTANLTVVVYSGRPVKVPAAEGTYAAVPVDSTSVMLTWPVGVPKPALRRGGWVLDTTYTAKGAYGSVNAEFYKVLETTDAGANQMVLDIQPPLRDGNLSQLTVLDGAVEVFERGNGSK